MEWLSVSTDISKVLSKPPFPPTSFDSSKWTELLPLILLSIRTTIKTDLDCSPTQLVYGTTLRLPGQFVAPYSTLPVLDPSLYVDRLRSAMQQLLPITVRLQAKPSHLPNDLNNCTHVFVRHDAVRKPLQPPYDGPFKVLACSTKFFTVLIKGKPQTISLDRLKVAHMDSASLLPSLPSVPSVDLTAPASSSRPAPHPVIPVSSASPQPAPVRTTRSGRRVHFPDRLVSTYYI